MKQFYKRINIWDHYGKVKHFVTVYTTERGYLFDIDGKATIKAISTNRDDLDTELQGILEDLYNK